jgi:cytidylate kinase
VSDEMVKVFILAQTVNRKNEISERTKQKVERLEITFVDVREENEKTAWLDIRVSRYSE